MKKLNRKGFTLIELLAIIVILAIIMVVTIPTVLSSMGTAREDVFKTSANTVADWVEKQYTQSMMQQYDSSFTNFCTSATYGFCATKERASGTATAVAALTDENTKTLLKSAGVDPKNYAYLYIKVTNGRACVKLGASNTGDFKEYAYTAANKRQPVSSTGC